VTPDVKTDEAHSRRDGRKAPATNIA